MLLKNLLRGAGCCAALLAWTTFSYADDDHDLAPRSHHRDDTADGVNPDALDAAVQFGLLLVDGIDAAVADGRGEPSPTRA